MQKVVAIITAGGGSRRFNRSEEGIPKQYMPLAGVAMISSYYSSVSKS